MTPRVRLGMISRSQDRPELFCLGLLEVCTHLSSLILPSFPFPSPKVVGCDHKLDSTKQEDKCLQCGGDGSTCYPVTGTFDADDLSRGGITQGALKGSVACLGSPVTFSDQGLRPSDLMALSGSHSGHVTGRQWLCPSPWLYLSWAGTLTHLCSLISHC